jgi:hypothetical protein
MGVTSAAFMHGNPLINALGLQRWGLMPFRESSLWLDLANYSPGLGGP